MRHLDGKYLTFILNEEEYGIPIYDVKEIIGITDITGIPKTPDYLKGVINLRGKIIPVIDLRIKMGMDGKDYTQKTCIIVVEIAVHENKKLMGVIVDTVSEVIAINETEIEENSEQNNCFEEELFMGLAKIKEKVIILVDVEKIFNSQESFLLKY